MWPTFAHAESLEVALRTVLGKLPEPGAACGAAVVDLQTGRHVFAHNGDRALIPASNEKLVAIATAIDVLGPDFEFRTVLARRGADLVVIGDGDPSLGDPVVSERDGVAVTVLLDEWVAVLRRHGIDAVAGDIVIDDTIFDEQWTHPDWTDDDVRRGYGAPVGALNYYTNCVTFTVSPAEQAGEPVVWSVEPATTLVTVTNRCKSGGKNRPAIDRPAVSLAYVLTGLCRRQTELPPVPVVDPGQFFGDVLRTHLIAHGIRVNGVVRKARVLTETHQLPAPCEVLHVHATPLEQVATRAGKDSQNLYAECLFKRAGYEFAKTHGQSRPVGSWESARAAARALLARAGVSDGELVIADGCGISRSNHASADDFVRLLTYMHGHRGWATFGRSLSVAGRDGKLRKRMKKVPGLVCAKTGYIRGVRTLSGYVETPDRRMYAFSVLFNDVKKGTLPFNKVHDRFCHTLATWTP